MTTRELSLPVYVIHWNAAERLRRCLTAFQQSRGIHARLTVIDNASSQDSLETIQDLQSSIPFELSVLEENRGYSGGANYAKDLAVNRGESVLAIASHDVIPRHDCLIVMLESLRKHPACGAVGPLLSSGSHGGVVADGGRWIPKRGAAEIAPKSWRNNEEGSRETIRADWISGSLVLWRTVCLQSIGGYDNSLFAYCEDVDACLRAQEAGWNIRIALGAHTYEPGTTVDVRVKTYLLTRNTALLIRRYEGGLSFLNHLVWKLSHIVRSAVGAVAPWRSTERRLASRSACFAQMIGIWHTIIGRCGRPPVLGEEGDWES